MKRQPLPLDRIIKNTGEWLKGKGPDHDIVISSRIRLARNISGFVFSDNMTASVATELVDGMEAAIQKSASLKKSFFVRDTDLTETEKEILVERHLISRDHAQSKKRRAVCFTEDEVISIMINEEDHLRLQVLRSGFSLKESWNLINAVDNELEKNLSYAFTERLGFLTACPTNVGTGLRASCMLHIPALVMTKQVNRVIQALSKLNVAVRGLYGEGTQASGNLFQFSNQVTLGKTEDQLILDLEKVVHQIVDHEKEAREALQSKKADKLADQIWRSIGILKSARSISSGETNSLLSLVRLGCDLGVISNISKQSLNELFIHIQPGHLQKLYGKNLSAGTRDEFRAVLVRRKLANVALD